MLFASTHLQRVPNPLNASLLVLILGNFWGFLGLLKFDRCRLTCSLPAITSTAKTKAAFQHKQQLMQQQQMAAAAGQGSFAGQGGMQQQQQQQQQVSLALWLSSYLVLQQRAALGAGI